MLKCARKQDRKAGQRPGEDRAVEQPVSRISSVVGSSL